MSGCGNGGVSGAGGREGGGLASMKNAVNVV